MKRFAVLLILSVIVIFVGATHTLSVEVALYGPNQFLRTQGAPDQFRNTFPGSPGRALLIIHNGDEAGKNRTSSATITLNGTNVAPPDRVNEEESLIEIPVNLRKENKLEVGIDGDSGSFISIELLQNVKAEAAAVIGPEGGVVAVTDPESELYGIKIDIPVGLLEGNKVISVSTSDSLPGTENDYQVVRSIKIEPLNIEID